MLHLRSRPQDAFSHVEKPLVSNRLNFPEPEKFRRIVIRRGPKGL